MSDIVDFVLARADQLAARPQADAFSHATAADYRRIALAYRTTDDVVAEVNLGNALRKIACRYELHPDFDPAWAHDAPS